MTARKRSESLADVLLAISAESAETLHESGVTSVSGLQTIKSALHIVSGYSETAPRINLRGFGNFEFAATATPLVGVYADEVY